MGESIKCVAIINLYDDRTLLLSTLKSTFREYFTDELNNMIKTFHSLHSSKKEISNILNENHEIISNFKVKFILIMVHGIAR